MKEGLGDVDSVVRVAGTFLLGGRATLLVAGSGGWLAPLRVAKMILVEKLSAHVTRQQLIKLEPAL